MLRIVLLVCALAALATTPLMPVVAPFGPDLPGDGIPFYGDDE